MQLGSKQQILLSLLAFFHCVFQMPESLYQQHCSLLLGHFPGLPLVKLAPSLYQRLSVPPSSWVVRGLVPRSHFTMFYCITSDTNSVSLVSKGLYGIKCARVLFGEWFAGDKGKRDQDSAREPG